MKVEVAVLGFPSLVIHMVSVDGKQHLKKKKNWIVLDCVVVQYDLQVGHSMAAIVGTRCRTICNWNFHHRAVFLHKRY